MTNLDKIIKRAEAAKEARAKSTQGEWFLSVVDSHEAIWIDREKALPITIDDMNFIDLAANESTWMAETIVNLAKALAFYADDNNWYLQKDQITGSEVRCSIDISDTESFGYQESPYTKSILQMFAGKHAKEALADAAKDSE